MFPLLWLNSIIITNFLGIIYAQHENRTVWEDEQTVIDADDVIINDRNGRKNLLSDREIIENLLRNYRFPDPSSNITVAVHISIDRILNDLEHECNFWLTIEQKWVENKLVYEEDRPNGAHIRLRSSSYIWNPSIAISNAYSVHYIGKEEIELHSNGMVQLIQRYSSSLISIKFCGSLNFF
ncbi:unnamed protein product [Gongylonema pulchrum]|uniref:Neur_chan_LBD domain-containing protein n=1 Tax=Gongylonema pulchrum TaxID=637853 RepID=A0A183E2S4_9BILA|nr:unnamed protein product [Gongylonema pulchrum]